MDDRRDKIANSWDTTKQFAKTVFEQAQQNLPKNVNWDKFYQRLDHVNQQIQIVDQEIVSDDYSIDDVMSIIEELDDLGKFIQTDWNSVYKSVRNIVDKIKRNLPISDEEKDILRSAPREIVDAAESAELSEPPVPTQPKVKRVRKKKPEEEERPITVEEIERLLNESPEAKVVNTFFPEALNKKELKGEPAEKYIDASFDTLLYLKSLGYNNQIRWVIGPEHQSTFRSHKELKQKGTSLYHKTKGIVKDRDKEICDYLAGVPLTIDEVISYAYQHAEEHGYSQLHPITSLSHPGCRCHLELTPPIDPSEIPDTAPGVPTYGTDEEKNQYKVKIHAKLVAMAVDRWTFLSDEIYKASETTEAYVIDDADIQRQFPYEKPLWGKPEDETGWGGTMASSKERIKNADKVSLWVKDIQPVIIPKDFMLASMSRIIRPIPHSYIGFQLHKTDKYSRVYLSELNRIIYIPTERIQVTSLKPSEENEYTSNKFIEVDNMLGIIIKVLDDNSILCFLPDFNTLAVVDDGVVLELT